MSSVTLSMIVKNEEKHLAGCLDSVKGVVDKIVIVDTGSTDSTIEIAKRYKAEIHQFDWVDDFSAARNYALSHSPSDWVLYLDADERLDEKSKDHLRKIVTQKDKLGVRCKIYNIDEVNKKPKLQNSTRLFRYSNKIRFSGRAHEQIDNSLLANGYEIINSELVVNHIGYNIDKDGLREKAQRNLKLLLKEYKENNSGYYAFQIANTYNVLRDKENTFTYFSLAVKDANLPNEYRSLSLSNIAEYHQDKNHSAEAMSAINEAIKVDPENIIVNLTASEIYYKAGKGAEAVAHCITAFELNKNKSNDKSSNRLLDIFVDEEKILYHGLHISYKLNEQTGIEYFFSNLEAYKSNNKLSWQKELHIIQMITSNSILSFEDVLSFETIIKEHNIDFYFQLLDHYTHTDSKLLVEKKLIDKFPDNVKLYNRYAADLSENGDLGKAISLLEKAVQRFPEATSIIIYLISLYLQRKDFGKLESLLNTSREINKHNHRFLEHLNTIEKKISSIKIHTN